MASVRFTGQSLPCSLEGSEPSYRGAVVCLGGEGSRPRPRMFRGCHRGGCVWSDTHRAHLHDSHNLPQYDPSSTKEEQNVWLPQNVPHSPAGRTALSRRRYRTLPEDVPHSPEGSPAQRPALSRRTSLEN
ncbi:hypothetical protein Bbelb_157610 [Branchiostoma belcheri]|nr:hypothetical protein Bbelb_157610 [Branchiostoma belcheri]